MRGFKFYLKTGDLTLATSKSICEKDAKDLKEGEQTFFYQGLPNAVPSQSHSIILDAGSKRPYFHAASFKVGCTIASCLRWGSCVDTSIYNDLSEATSVRDSLHDKGFGGWLSPEAFPGYVRVIDYVVDDIGAEVEKICAQIKS